MSVFLFNILMSTHAQACEYHTSTKWLRAFFISCHENSSCLSYCLLRFGQYIVLTLTQFDCHDEHIHCHHWGKHIWQAIHHSTSCQLSMGFCLNGIFVITWSNMINNYLCFCVCDFGPSYSRSADNGFFYELSVELVM